ncbi:MAG: asparagine synthase (glutamine-hydrolyzing), partial [Vicinamibacterales bacterium]
MCGICGELSFAGRAPVAPNALEAMTSRLPHRGPDHGAVFRSERGEAGLGFRRLSIIDLRAAANQPIGNEDGSVQLVFNGEIYNYRDLRPGLVSRGHQFQSNSDSEVIVHLYEELGDRAIDELDGMFALAIWDARRKTITLARDRAGKKPLYIYQDAERMLFASEIKSLLAHPGATVAIDEGAVPLYFLHGFVPHPRTLYRNIRHLEPGTLEVISQDGTTAPRKYWQLTFPDVQSAPLAPRSRRRTASDVRALVTAAVERRLMSDVPLGAFLSGGLDSTIIVGVMSQLLREPVRTFTIGFEGDAAFDETSIARNTAARFGTEHTEFRVKPSAVGLLDTLIYHHDGPFGDSSAIP